LDAISMIESGNNDHAIGRLGEVSRYQILPHIWRSYTTSRSYADPIQARHVAHRHLEHLETLFRKKAGREPTEFERYVVWNAGVSYYASKGFSRWRVPDVIRERAERFVNLRNDSTARWRNTAEVQAAPGRSPRPAT
jgi:hypothetical protein